MRARIDFSRAPHDSNWSGPLVEPVIVLNNVVLAACMYPGWRTARVQWDPDLDRLISFLRDRTSPVVLFGWHAHMLLTACAFRHLPADVMPTGIGHDGFRSRAVQQTATLFRIPVWAYRRRSPVPPKQQLADFLAESRRIVALFPDAGGPEGEGWRYIRSELSYLLSNRPLMIPVALLRTASKYLGYRLGRAEARLPLELKRALSLNRRYWG